MANYLERLLARSCFNDEERLVVQLLFEPTPWLVELSPEEIDHQCDIVGWCEEEIGTRSNPLRGKPGDWRITDLKGRMWIGFRTRRQLLEFKGYRNKNLGSRSPFLGRNDKNTNKAESPRLAVPAHS